ncbi:hypothetical protein RYH73_08305 [Olivibacter sp. CPCC 100613]|uniref:hypothetical protein n=1 Tax=Olivibacter sp. CPCC 100613 TaxID=3079931 RepID=UPI002FF9CA2E
MHSKKLLSLVILTFFTHAICHLGIAQTTARNDKDAPRIINIVNFIRQTDYRVKDADRLLFETVAAQIKLVDQYKFPATFLFQYDALINPKYQDLMKSQLPDNCEIGAWWEITQPHVEAAGIKWRGEHSWVSHANIAFTTGYSPEEREKLVDVYMEKFKEIYGQYPKSVGSWFIDSHSLAYMYEKYGILASCNCKDQVGTDGYTLWGGYWNQAYYPSRLNAYMPAQTEAQQIPVPIFRMLGSDPIYQYDTGLGNSRQGVISLEPVYPESGMDKRWVENFLESIVNQPCLAFNYAQAGQENSFTWDGMKKGLLMQFPLFDSLAKAGKIRIETLANSGTWFKKKFPVTPPTAVTTLQDLRNEGRKSVWFNSRYYRSNLLWEKEGFRFRDLHLFDEKFESSYLKKAGTDGQFFYYALPLVDGFNWSTKEDRAGLYILKVGRKGEKTRVQLQSPIVKEKGKNVLEIQSSDEEGNRFTIVFHEDHFKVSCKPKKKDFRWLLELQAPATAKLSFQSTADRQVKAVFHDFSYGLSCKKGTVQQSGNLQNATFRMLPSEQQIVVDCTNSLTR